MKQLTVTGNNEAERGEGRTLRGLVSDLVGSLTRMVLFSASIEVSFG